MTSRRLGLAIDLDTCVGCHACATNCKEWNTGGGSGPLTDVDAYGAAPRGVWFNRVFTYEVGSGAEGRTVHYPRNCLHCADPDCVRLCPTGASYKRAEDGVVLIDQALCVGCKLCSWVCPYGAREYDEIDGVMKKCTLCVDRIGNQTLAEAERVPACVATCPARARHFGDFADPHSAVSQMVRQRGGFDPMPEAGTRPTSKYLPPRPRRADGPSALTDGASESGAPGLSPRWAAPGCAR